MISVGGLGGYAPQTGEKMQPAIEQSQVYNDLDHESRERARKFWNAKPAKGRENRERRARGIGLWFSFTAFVPFRGLRVPKVCALSYAKFFSCKSIDRANDFIRN